MNETTLPFDGATYEPEESLRFGTQLWGVKRIMDDGNRTARNPAKVIRVSVVTRGGTMVTDRERADKKKAAELIGICLKWPITPQQTRTAIEATVEAFAAIRKERDDLWRKKVVEIQKINAEDN